MTGTDLSPSGDGFGEVGRTRIWGTLNPSGTSGDNLSGFQLGGTVGVDHQFNGMPILAGVAVNLSTSQYATGAPSGSVHDNQFSMMAYGVGRAGPAYVSAIGMFGVGHTAFRRNLYSLGLNLASSVGFTNKTAAGVVEAGYTLHLGATGLNLTPYAAIEPTAVFLDGASENFAGVGAGLQYHGTTVTSLPTYLGVQLDTSLRFLGGRLDPFARIAWMHDLMPSRNVPRSFAELLGYDLRGNAIPTVSNAAYIKLGGRYRITESMNLQLAAESQLSAQRQTFGGQVQFSVGW